MSLHNKKCQPCEGGVAPLTPAQIKERMVSLPEWRISDTGRVISRNLAFTNFVETMAFVNAVAVIAEEQQHHPDIECGYNYCRVNFTTHAIGGLSENDFICAALIDQQV